MRYKIQYRIETLAENAVGVAADQPSFTVDSVILTHWDFNHRDGWLSDAWLAEDTVEADNFNNAYKMFIDKLTRIVPRVAFVSQCYTESINQPFLIVKEGSDVGYFYDPFDSGHVGLMFMDEQKQALDSLLAGNIPDAFFYYWNDAVNTIGYTPKLLLMFSAVEALAKQSSGKKDWTKIENILGKDLSNEIFASNNKGLRHRLVHGEYFSSQDFAKNYVDTIHIKVMEYFNNVVLGAKLLSVDVVNPQRHFFGNKMLGRYYIKSKDGSAELDLKHVLEDFSTSESHTPTKYVYVYDDTLTKDY